MLDDTNLKLQWGRRSSSAERYRRRPVFSPKLLASMGPPIFIGGEPLAVQFAAVHGGASMGPPIFIGGERQAVVRAQPVLGASMGPPIFIGGEVHLHVEHLILGELASMGPPIFIGGEVMSTSCSPRAARCFNGAADLHRRRDSSS